MCKCTNTSSYFLSKFVYVYPFFNGLFPCNDTTAWHFNGYIVFGICTMLYYKKVKLALAFMYHLSVIRTLIILGVVVLITQIHFFFIFWHSPEFYLEVPLE